MIKFRKNIWEFANPNNFLSIANKIVPFFLILSIPPGGSSTEKERVLFFTISSGSRVLLETLVLISGGQAGYRSWLYPSFGKGGLR